MNPFFSVLIPVYNQMGKMDSCIESLKAQTFRDFEVIWVDDCSNDGSGEFLEELCRQNDQYAVYHHEKNSSLTAARYTGMQHAKGQYICFLDSDDWWEPDTLACIREKFLETGADIVRFGLYMEPAHTKLMPCATDNFLKTCMEGNFPPAIWKNAYHADIIRGVLEHCEPFYCNMGEDTYYCGVLFGLSHKDVVLDKALYHYAMGEGMSNTGSTSTMTKLKRDFDSVCASSEHLIRFMKEVCPENLPLAEKGVRLMRRFILWQNMQHAADYVGAVEYLNFFREQGDLSTYRFGCNDLLPYRMLSDLKRRDDRFGDLAMPDLHTSMVEKEYTE